MRCNFITCRYNKENHCTQSDKRKECLDVANKVLCIDATDNNAVTKSGKDNNAKDADLSPEEAKELKAERDYWEREAKKWCAKLGEIRLWIGEQN